MNWKKKRKNWKIFSPVTFTIITSMLLTILFIQEILLLITPEFVKSLLMVAAFSTFGLGLIGFQINKKSGWVDFRLDFFSLTFIMLLSAIFGMLYLAFPFEFLPNITFGTQSILFFIGGIFYFLIIIGRAIAKLFNE